MHSRILAVTAALLLSSVAQADPIAVTEQNGSPAIEGNGSSSTTISVVGGAASVTVESTGSIGAYTHSGTVEGEGAIGVPQLGLRLGGGTASDDSPAGRPGPPARDGTLTAKAGGRTSAALDGSSDASATCAEITGPSATEQALALVTDENLVSIVPVCDGDAELPSRLLLAIEKNNALMAALAASGVSLSDVVEVRASEGSAILLVRES
jgi:hypothetical protein